MVKKYIWLYILLPTIGIPTAGITWFFWTLPSPEAVCQKTLEISSGTQPKEVSLAQCAKTLAQEKDVSGIMEYRKEAKCIMDAKSKSDIDVCRQEKK